MAFVEPIATPTRWFTFAVRAKFLTNPQQVHNTSTKSPQQIHHEFPSVLFSGFVAASSRALDSLSSWNFAQA